MHQRPLIYVAWIGIVCLSFALRLYDLDERPIHADEATGARILSNQLEGDAYAFNPRHFHGPLLRLTSVPLARARGESGWADLSTSTLRLGPVVAGCLLVLTPLLWVRQFGQAGALAAAALLASSPLLVYYNRMYIHESWLTLFAMLGCAAVFRLTEGPTKRMGLIAGLCIGLMFATKETFVITILSWLPAVGLCYLIQNTGGGAHSRVSRLRQYLMPAILLALAATVTAAYFYSDGFRSPQGLVDAVRTYFIYETTDGHEKSFGYYFKLLLWPKQQLGLWWSEASIALFALITCRLAYLKCSNRSTVVFLAVATLGHFAIYSMIGYKTPWLMLVPWAHACLLAGCAFSYIRELQAPLRFALSLLLLAGLGYQTMQSIHANGRLANDSRNPYAYVPTSKDADKLKHWLDELAASQPERSLSPIAVVGREYWPLPWYLRSFDTVGYWPEPIADFSTFALVFAMPAQVQACDDLLGATHATLPRGLRANVPIVLYLRNDIWQGWINAPEK